MDNKSKLLDIKQAYNFLKDDDFRIYIEKQLDLDRSYGEWENVEE